MKKTLFSLFILLFTVCLHAQLNHDYDSVTISHFVDRKPADGDKSTRVLNTAYNGYLVNERTIWINDGKTDSLSYIFSLTNRIWDNGTKSVGRCFIPRHSINYYRSGKVSRYLLVCFQCNGMEFSDLPIDNTGLLVSMDLRIQQIEELKILFKDYL